MIKFTSNIYRYVLSFVMGCILLMPSDILAKPAYRGPITHIQPDGTELTIYRSGDENHKELRDANGCQLYITEDGWARRLDNGMLSLRRAAEAEEPTRKKFLFSGTPFPCEGDPHALVILVEFQDRTFSMDDPNDFYTRMLNEEGFSDYGATGSARDFFVENSIGQFKPIFDVYGPVMLPRSMKYYGGNSLLGDDIRPYQALIDAAWILDKDLDFAQYDIDEDGQIDNVFIFYAGYGEADSPDYDAIWPHSADLDVFNIGREFYHDGKKLNRYGMTNEIDYSYRRPDGIGTFVHEFSHVLGLPDEYCTNYSGSFTGGTYSVLDYGPYNNQGRTPPHYNIFQRYSLGWLTPIVPEPGSSGVYVLDPIHISNTGLMLPTDNENEFYLFENRQQVCCDRFIPGHGMLVWHIDFVQSVWDDNVVNNLHHHLHVDLVEADHRQSESTRAGDVFPGINGVTEFSSVSAPALRSWSNQPVGFDITMIEEVNDKIKFLLTAQESKVSQVEDGNTGISVRDGYLYNDSAEEAVIYDMSGTRVGQAASGESTPLPAGIYIIKCGAEVVKVTI
ncbi:MAG: M6 family metalloprotease domain-containing protein [Muribaculaceae bacterium]|nr:M6 family metalloprotease domain-containing protein [Muribaculaceae bacterium]